MERCSLPLSLSIIIQEGHDGDTHVSYLGENTISLIGKSHGGAKCERGDRTRNSAFIDSSQQNLYNSWHAKVQTKTIFHFYDLQFPLVNAVFIASLYVS